MLISFIAKGVAERLEPKDSVAMISIIEPDEEVRLKDGWKHLLSLRFHDVDTKNKLPIITASGVEKITPTVFDKVMAGQIIDFIKNLPENIRAVTVHCHGGISRSSAVAKFLAEEIYNADFPKDYSLYNRKVYSTLMDVYHNQKSY